MMMKMIMMMIMMIIIIIIIIICVQNKLSGTHRPYLAHRISASGYLSGILKNTYH